MKDKDHEEFVECKGAMDPIIEATCDNIAYIINELVNAQARKNNDEDIDDGIDPIAIYQAREMEISKMWNARIILHEYPGVNPPSRSRKLSLIRKRGGR